MEKLNRKKIYAISAVFGSMILGCFIYWIYSLFYVSTDDAYVNANSVEIASRVSGEIISLNVTNNEKVKKGQLLMQIDPKPFLLAIQREQAQIQIDQANLVHAQLTEKRVLILAHSDALSQQAKDDAVANLNRAEGQLALDQAQLNYAQLNLGYTTITAPADAIVTNLSLRPHDLVSTNQVLFALIMQHEYWVDANFKESDIGQIKIGDPANITIDMYPNHTFHSVVDSISGASGNAFSLLPPQNATGNWVKVTQRVPVKILLSDSDPHYSLHVGTSANVTIRVK